MQDQDEIKHLAASFRDKSRKTLRVGKKVLIPHKVKKDGSVVSPETFDGKVDISALNLNELRFLEVFRNESWDFDKACEKVGVSLEQGKTAYRKCLWFKQEDAFVKAKAKVPTTSYILAKDLDNVEKGIVLDDSQHKSLDRMAKITGSFQTAAAVNIQTNIFQMPRLTPEALAKLKEFADAQADVIEGEIAA